jgi:hypothetical protein
MGYQDTSNWRINTPSQLPKKCRMKIARVYSLVMIGRMVFGEVVCKVATTRGPI